MAVQFNPPLQRSSLTAAEIKSVILEFVKTRSDGEMETGSETFDVSLVPAGTLTVLENGLKQRLQGII